MNLSFTRGTFTPHVGHMILAEAARSELGLSEVVFMPAPLIEIWPWALSPLTARVGGGWYALAGVLWLGVSRDPRWSGTRIAWQSQALSLALILIGVVRAWDNFDQSNPMTWFILASLIGPLVVIAGVYPLMEARARNGEYQPSTAQ